MVEKHVRKAITAGIISFLLAVISFTFLVAKVQYEGGRGVVRFAVGMVRPSPDPLCAGLSDARCIEKKLSFNPAEIESYWGDKQIHLSELLLTLVYTLFLSTFGWLIGLLVLRQSTVIQSKKSSANIQAASSS